jgi:hypothetical protein
MAKEKVVTQGGRRLGRPPGTLKSVRYKRVVTLMTDAEFEKLTKIANEKEKPVSGLAHQIISRYLNRCS